MTPETKKKFNMTAGSIFLTLGLICFAVAAYVASVPAVSKPAPTNPQPVVNVSSCRDTLLQMGYQAALTGNGNVTAKDLSLDDPQASLIKATAAMGLCKLKMTDFCMGSACSDTGLTFTLTTAGVPGQSASTTDKSAAAKSSASSPSK